MSHYFGTVTITAGTQARATLGSGQGMGWVLLGNESGLTVKVTLEGTGQSRSLYPSSVDKFTIPSNFNGNLLFDPVALLSNVSAWPSSFIQIDTFGPNEEPQGTYPMSLPRNTNVGNTVPTTGGGSTTLQNDNNAANTTVIESTQTGSSGSNMFADNSGNFYLAQWISSTYTKLFQVIANGASVLKLGATGLLSEVLGSLKVDQNVTVLGTSSLDNAGITTDGSGNVTKVGSVTASGAISGASASLTGATSTGSVASSGHIDITTNNTTLRMADSGATLRDVLYADGANETCLQAVALNGVILLKNQDGTTYFIIGKQIIGVTASGDVLDASSVNTYLKSRSGGDILMQVPNGTSTWKFTGNDLSCLNGGGINFNVGRIKDINALSGAGTGTFNHGLSGTPNYVGPMDNTVGSQTMGADTYTSTQVHITAGASHAWKGVCYR